MNEHSLIFVLWLAVGVAPAMIGYNILTQPPPVLFGFWIGFWVGFGLCAFGVIIELRRSHD